MRAALILQLGRCGFGLSGRPAWGVRLGLAQVALVAGVDVLGEIRAPGSHLAEWFTMRDALAHAHTSLQRLRKPPV